MNQTQTERAAHPILSADGISIDYDEHRVIDGLDLSIERGSFTALLGPNGSGKSTLLRALSRLQATHAGTIHLQGRPLINYGSRELARHVGLLSQGPTAPPGLTVEALTRQGRYPHRSLFSRWSKADSEACEQALQQTGMLELRHESLEHLSGGQRQRAWIAMALAQQTEILLLDEPTTFLDIHHQIGLMELLEGLSRDGGKTIVAVLHDINQAARHADRVALLHEGRLLAEGSAKQVISADHLETVFGVVGRVVEDDDRGRPHFMARERAHGKR